MASTRETARVMAHAHAAGVKVIAIGDSGQLSSVQAGGWLGSLTRRLGSYELRDVMRQRDPRERQLSAAFAGATPPTTSPTRTAPGSCTSSLTTRSAPARASVRRSPRGASARLCAWGQAVLIARDNDRRERLNALVRAELRRDGRLGTASTRRLRVRRR